MESHQRAAPLRRKERVYGSFRGDDDAVGDLADDADLVGGAGTGWLPRSMVSRRFKSAVGSKASCAELERVGRARIAGTASAPVESDTTAVFSTGSRFAIRGAAPRIRTAARSCSAAGQSAGSFERAVAVSAR